MGLGISADAEFEHEQSEMEEEMKEKVGWLNPRGWFHEYWLNAFDAITGLDGYELNCQRIDALEVHKAYIHALKCNLPEPTVQADELLRWLEICCKYNASLFFF